MNADAYPHPGRSVDFLSRLHDGELSAAERARFESHRARCAECRRAAIEFEDAIAMFRSDRGTSPRADLAARILRKVQATNRPRVPFPAGFRLDLGWAGLLAAALVALMVVMPLALRRSDAPQPPSESPAAAARETASEPPAGQREDEPQISGRIAEAPPSLARAKPQAAPRRGAPPKEEKVDRFADQRSAATSANAGAPETAPEAPAAQSGDLAVPRPPAAAERERRAAAAPDPSRAVGGEGDAASSMAKSVRWKLRVEPLDGFGRPPALVTSSLSDVPDSAGRTFVVLVDSQGAVRSVADERSRDRVEADAGAADAVSAAVERLRFEPGTRPRRLRISIE